MAKSIKLDGDHYVSGRKMCCASEPLRYTPGCSTGRKSAGLLSWATL
jgi:hypothetical protein